MMTADVEIKTKAIEEYNKLVKRLEQGYLDNFDHILNIINFIEIKHYLNNPSIIEENLLNYI